MQLRYQKLHPEALEPVQGYSGDLGVDLRTPEAFSISARGEYVVDTGIRIQIPDVPTMLEESFHLGCFIWSKSGLSVRSNIEKGAGVIDPNYTGPLKIKLYNHGDQDVHFERGHKIAQMVFMLCARIQSMEETDLSHLQSERGAGGFGSSGK